MNEIRRGTYTSGESNEDGTPTVLTEKGFTFQEETGQELAFDLYDHDVAGTALLFGNQVFFLKYWTDEQLDNAAEAFSAAVTREKGRRDAANQAP